MTSTAKQTLTLGELAEAAIPGLTKGHPAGLHELAVAQLWSAVCQHMEKVGEDVPSLVNVPVRFFGYDEDGEIEEIELSRFAWEYGTFLSFDYERHTVRENGCSQVCLTISGAD